MIKIEIKHRYTGNILFRWESENNTLRKTLEKAIKENANLSNADLGNADLGNANLRNANLRNANLENANLENANLENADLRNAELRNAKNKDKAFNIPMFCKWNFGITGDKISIGCETRTIKEWDKFFKSDEIIETPRDSEDFKRIEAVYKGLKAYLKHLS